ncbi:MAG TPA: PAS domain S-box protein [Ilumatobacteraceae bacterium]
MRTPVRGADAAAIELASGGVVVTATPAAAEILGAASVDGLVGRVVALVDASSPRSDAGLDGWTMRDTIAGLSSLALFAQDADGRIVSWNRGAERVFGYSEADIVGSSLAALLPSHLRDTLDAVAERVAAGERIDRLFTEVRRQDGMPVPVALSLSPVLDASGRLTGALGVAQELTEIRLAQAALAEVEERFREWEALAHVGRWLWDVGTNAVQWSDELHRMHGVDPRDFEGTLEAHLAAIAAGDRVRIHELMLTAVTTGEGFEDEYRPAAADEQWFAVRAEVAVGSSGEVVGLRGISHAKATPRESVGGSSAESTRA